MTAIILAVFIIWLILPALFPELLLLHHDLGWHLRTGEYILRNNWIIPEFDPWSFTTTHNYRWLNTAWLWDVLQWSFYNFGGLTFLFVEICVITAATQGIIAKSSLQLGAKATATVLSSLLCGFALIGYELPDTPVAIAPQTITLLFVALSQSICLRANTRTPWELILLQLLWVNVHSGYPAGIISGLVWSLCASSISTRNRILFVVLLVMASVISPYGLGNVEVVTRTIQHSSVRYTTEWYPFSIVEAPLTSALLGACILGCLFKDIRKGVPRLLLIQAGFWLLNGILQRRHIALCLITVAPIMSVLLHNLVSKVIRENTVSKEAGIKTYLTSIVLIVCTIASVAPIARYRMQSDKIEWPERIYPKDEIDYLIKHHPGERILNDWNLGGFIIFRANGQIPVFIDGRASSVYPPELFKVYESYLDKEDWTGLTKHFDVNRVIIPNYRYLANDFFKSSPDWILEYGGPSASIYERNQTINSN